MTQPRDPVCPACGDAVGSTSTFCMHCDADFDAPATVGDEDASTGGAEDEGADATADPAVPEGSTKSDCCDHGTAASDASDESTLVGPRVYVAAVALTVVVGLIPTLALVVVFAEGPPLWLLASIPGMLGVTVGILFDRQDAGIDAFAKALYVGAASFVVVPIAFFVFVVGEQTIRTRLTFALVFGLAGCSFAIPVFFLGWWLRPDDD